MIEVYLSNQFTDNFLNQFTTDKQELIKKIIIEYADGKVLLPRPKDCKTKKERKKVALPDANVIVIYDDFGDRWNLIDGAKMFDRAA